MKDTQRDERHPHSEGDGRHRMKDTHILGMERHPHSGKGDERHPHSVPRRRECARSEQASLVFKPGRFVIVRQAGSSRTGPNPRSDPLQLMNSPSHRARCTISQSIRDWTQAYRLLGSRSRLPILSLTAQSSEKCDSCGALTVEPAAARLLGQDLQRSATADRSFEPATKLPNRLDPAVVFQMQSLQDRCEMGRNRPSTRPANLTSRPVHQRKVGVESDGQTVSNKIRPDPQDEV